MSDQFIVTKTIVSWIVGAGVGKIIHAVINNNIEPETTTEKVTVPAAGFVAAMMAKDLTRQYTDAKIDEIAEQVTKIKKFISNSKK
jgi:hypothetical protein